MECVAILNPGSAACADSKLSCITGQLSLLWGPPHMEQGGRCGPSGLFFSLGWSSLAWLLDFALAVGGGGGPSVLLFSVGLSSPPLLLDFALALGGGCGPSVFLLSARWSSLPVLLDFALAFGGGGGPSVLFLSVWWSSLSLLFISLLGECVMGFCALAFFWGKEFLLLRLEVEELELEDVL